jgi:hypothetical protein
LQIRKSHFHPKYNCYELIDTVNYPEAFSVILLHDSARLIVSVRRFFRQMTSTRALLIGECRQFIFVAGRSTVMAEWKASARRRI